ncbi:hypothetical protein L596_029542 [Steinernema carpocapsae]|uniref:EGF-like domain-containing protein n=1 Tax=Steinernema carpocapsae TaxID=34508 RepID=A0A4U5LUX6_STECR|nr:hypothetical protein L596_029542 [Steinernema carpocapsae]
MAHLLTVVTFLFALCTLLLARGGRYVTDARKCNPSGGKWSYVGQQCVCYNHYTGDRCDQVTRCLHGQLHNGICLCNYGWHGDLCNRIFCFYGYADYDERHFQGFFREIFHDLKYILDSIPYLPLFIIATLMIKFTLFVDTVVYTGKLNEWRHRIYKVYRSLQEIELRMVARNENSRERSPPYEHVVREC